MTYTRKLLEAIVSEDRLSTKEIFDAAVRSKLVETFDELRPYVTESIFDEEVDVSKVMSDYQAGKMGSFKAQGGRKGLIKRKIAANLAKRAASMKEDADFLEDEDQLDEVSQNTLLSYLQKSRKKEGEAYKKLVQAGPYDRKSPEAKAHNKIEKNRNLAMSKIGVGVKPKVMAQEDYVAEDDMDLFDDDDKKPAKKQTIYVHTHKTSGKEIHSVNPKPPTNEFKTRKLREDVEEIDELSIKTLSKYVAKRGSQLRGRSGDAKKIDGINKALFKIKKK